MHNRIYDEYSNIKKSAAFSVGKRTKVIINNKLFVREKVPNSDSKTNKQIAERFRNVVKFKTGLETNHFKELNRF